MKKALALCAVVFLAGCFEIDQSINLQKNLSGTADFHLGIDFEPMVVVMAQFAHDMEGKKGPVTKAEIEKARADFKKNAKKSESKEPSRADIQKELPEGVKLLDFKATERDFGVSTDFKFGFDQLRQLVGVKLPSKEGGGDPTSKNVVDSPFENMELMEKGDTITIRTKPLNPAESVKEEAKDAPKLDADTEKLIKDAFGKMRVTYRITAPFTIVSSNATRREGNTLVWEYDMARFEELAKNKKSTEDFGVRVTYKR